MTRLLATLAAAGGATCALLVPASASPAQPRAGIGDETGTRLLIAAERAALELDYAGTQFVSFWSGDGAASAVVEVTHRRGSDILLRVQPTPHNPDGGNYRQGGGVVGVESGSFELLARNYEAVVETTDRVAGRPADVVVVRRPGRSPAARFWLDRATHLALRSEVLDADGQVLRASAFIDISFARPADAVAGIFENISPSGAEVATAALPDMRDAGWSIPEDLPHGLELVSARTTGEGDQLLLHLTYSDGVSTVSLFEQRGELDRGSLDGWERQRVGGVRVYEKQTFPRRLVWGGRGKVFTLVAECQRPLIADVVGALPHSEPRGGLLARLGRGVRRVGSWLNPFG